MWIIHAFVFCRSLVLLEIIIIAADVTWRGSFVPYSERCKQNNSVQWFLVGRQDKRWQNQPLAAPDVTPTGYTILLWKKTSHLSEETMRHRDHMVEILIRSWRWRQAHPPVRWGISCPTWASSWRRNLSQVCMFLSLEKSEASADLLCNRVIKPKVLMTARLPFFPFSSFFLSWCDGCQHS